MKYSLQRPNLKATGSALHVPALTEILQVGPAAWEVSDSLKTLKLLCASVHVQAPQSDISPFVHVHGKLFMKSNEVEMLCKTWIKTDYNDL